MVNQTYFCMIMALPQNKPDTGRDLYIITTAVYLAVLILHVTHYDITTYRVQRQCHQ